MKANQVCFWMRALSTDNWCGHIPALPEGNIIKQTQAKDILTGKVVDQIAKSNDTKRIGEEKLRTENKVQVNVKNRIRDSQTN